MAIPTPRPTRQNTHSGGQVSLGPNFSAGVVLSVDMSSYTAKVDVFAGFRKGVMHQTCLITHAAANYTSKTGAVFVPDIGDRVLLDWSSGINPTIAGPYAQIVNKDQSPGAHVEATPLREINGEDPLLRSSISESYRSGAPDIGPGDKVISSRGGSFLGILTGGLALLRGSRLAQIILNAFDDKVTILSRRFSIWSDFGQVNFRNDDGQTGIEVIGKDGDGKEAYLIKLGLDKLLGINLKNVFKFDVETNGNITLCANKATVDLQAPPSLNYRGSLFARIFGTKSQTIDGDYGKDVSGTVTEKMSKIVTICGGPENKVVSGICDKQYMSTKVERVQGVGLTSTSAEARGVRIASGDYNIDIGNPLTCGVGVPAPVLGGKLGSYNLSVGLGDINLSVLTKGNITHSTKWGDVTLSTLKGNCSVSTAIGDVEFSTKAGNVALTTMLGDVDLSTKVGNATFGTKTGTATIEAPLGITLKAGDASIEINPITGIKITNKGMELLATIEQLMTQLSSAQTPGYGGPLSTSAMIATLQNVNLKAIKVM